VADGTPATLRATLGDQVAELEGDGAAALVSELVGRGAVVASLRTERGYRIGLRGTADGTAELLRSARRLTRLVLRAPTLEDVYFARTQGKAR